jgi:hypothetical protein
MHVIILEARDFIIGKITFLGQRWFKKLSGIILLFKKCSIHSLSKNKLPKFYQKRLIF